MEKIKALFKNLGKWLLDLLAPQLIVLLLRAVLAQFKPKQWGDALEPYVKRAMLGLPQEYQEYFVEALEKLAEFAREIIPE